MLGVAKPEASGDGLAQSMAMMVEYIKMRDSYRAESVTECYSVGYIINGKCSIRDGGGWYDVPEKCAYLLQRGRHLVERSVGASGIFEQVIIHFGEDMFMREDSPRLSDEDMRIERAVTRGISECCTVEDLATRSFLSLSTFKRRFRRRYGTSPHRWLYERRLTLAHHIVTTTDIPTQEIAPLCGFPNVSHFISSFRRHYGTTPRRLRCKARRADNG